MARFLLAILLGVLVMTPSESMALDCSKVPANDAWDIRCLEKNMHWCMHGPTGSTIDFLQAMGAAGRDGDGGLVRHYYRNCQNHRIRCEQELPGGGHVTGPCANEPPLRMIPHFTEEQYAATARKCFRRECYR